MSVTRISRDIMLYIAFGIIAVSRNRSRSWNALPVDKVVRLYMEIVLLDIRC